MKNLDVKDLKKHDPFIWAFCDFEGNHVYNCVCLHAYDNEVFAYVDELDTYVYLDTLSFCDLYKM